MLEKIKNAYFTLWSDTFFFQRKKQNTDLEAFANLNILFGVQVFFIQMLVYLILKIDFILFENFIINALFYISTYFGIPSLMNYYIIFKKKDEIIDKYPHKNGKVFIYYVGIYFGIVLTFVLIGIILSS